MILLGDHNVEKIFQNNFSVRKAIYFSVEYYPLTSASLFWRFFFFFFYFFKNHQDLASNSTNWEFIHRPNFLMLKRNFQWQCPLCCFGMDTPLPEELGTHWDCLRLEVNFQSPGKILSPVFLSKMLCYKCSGSDFALGRVQETVGWGGGSSSRSQGQSRAAFPPSSSISALALCLMDRD